MHQKCASFIHVFIKYININKMLIQSAKHLYHISNIQNIYASPTKMEENKNPCDPSSCRTPYSLPIAWTSTHLGEETCYSEVAF